MELKQLRKLVTQESHNQYFKATQNIKNSEDLNHFVRWTLNKRQSFKGDFGTQKEKALKSFRHKTEKSLNETLSFIKQVESAGEFQHLTITIEWKNSRMWGYNPRAYTNFGFIGESIGGCGYDKRSTATAQALTLISLY